jgi:hypothetical protein
LIGRPVTGGLDNFLILRIGHRMQGQVIAGQMHWKLCLSGQKLPCRDPHQQRPIPLILDQPVWTKQGERQAGGIRHAQKLPGHLPHLRTQR